MATVSTSTVIQYGTPITANTAVTGTIPTAPIFPITKDLSNYSKTFSVSSTDLANF